MSPESLERSYVGKYQLIAEIGRGGAATVYLAVMQGATGFTKLFVVKLLHSDIGFDGEEMSMFMNEARLSARLNHPNVVQSLEFEEFEGRYYLAMEYLEGQALSRVLTPAPEGCAPLRLDHHLQILCDALGGLHYAHELCDYDGTPLNIVHRDVSPHNVFVTYEGVTKLLDFGIAKATGSKSNTTSGALKGKVAYMSPDQFDDGPVDRRVDVFAIGVMLWEAIAQRRMWKGLADLEIIRLLMQGSIPSIESAAPGVPAELARICSRALAADRDERYATAAEFRRDLEKYLASTGAHVTPTSISEYVSFRFADERKKIRSVTQEQLKRIEASVDEADVSILDLPRLSGTDLTRSGSHSGSRSGRSGRTPSGAARDRSAGAGERTEGGARSASATWAIRGALLLAVVAGTVGLVAWNRSTPGKTAVMAATPSQPAPAATPSVARPDTITLSLSASPAEARMWLDDVALPTNPYSGKFARDGAQHRVKIEAPGHLVRSEFIVFERDDTRSYTLEAEPAEPPRAKGAAPVRPVATARDAKDKPAATATAATRAIDENNPFR